MTRHTLSPIRRARLAASRAALVRMSMLATALGVAACLPLAGTPGSAPAPSAAAAPASTVATPPANGAALEAVWRARIDSARGRYTPADVRFMTDMIAHHAQALGMSNLAPTNGASESVRVLAARIINAQRDEIGIMQQWLRDRGQPVPEVHVDGWNVMVHTPGQDTHAGHGAHGGHGAGHVMEGMLTPEQMAALAAARGAEFDRLFLRSMIQHHKGAITMVNALFATDGAGQDEAVFKFASDVQVDQTTEVARMELMLETLGL